MALQTRSTQAWEFIDGPSQPRQRQLPANLWELHREEIVRLYENSGLTQARHLMKIRHGFVASENQYKYRIHTIWNIRKIANDGATRLGALHRLDSVGLSSASLASRGNSTEASYHGSLLSNEAGALTDVDAESNTVEGNEASKEDSSISNSFSQADESVCQLSPPVVPQTWSIIPPISASSGGSESSDSSSDRQLLTRNKRPCSVTSHSSAASRKRFRIPDDNAPSMIAIDLAEDAEAQRPFASESIGRDGQLETPTPANNEADQPLKFPANLSHNPHTHAAVSQFLIQRRRRRSATFAKDEFEARLQIRNMSWDNASRLREAAEVFTACKMCEPAFNIHYQVWSKLRLSDHCPWGMKPNLVQDQLIACARTASTPKNLATVQTMLEEYIETILGKETNHSFVLLCALLAEVQVKQNDKLAAHVIYSSILPLASPSMLPVGAQAYCPDVVADLHLLRLFAYSFLKRKESLPHGSFDDHPDILGELRSYLKEVWLMTAESQYDTIEEIVGWCCCQLKAPEPHELLALERFELERIASSLPAIWKKKLTTVALVFSFLLGRLFLASHLNDHSSRRYLRKPIDTLLRDIKMYEVSFRPAHATSGADILWTISTMIAEDMYTEDAMMSSRLTVALILRKASILTASLQKLEKRAFLDHLFKTLPASSADSWLRPMGQLPGNIQWAPPKFVSMCIEQVVQAWLNVKIEDTSVSLGSISDSSYKPRSFLAPEQSVEEIFVLSRPASSEADISKQESMLTPLKAGNAESIRTSTHSSSTRSSMRSFRRFAEYVRRINESHLQASSASTDLPSTAYNEEGTDLCNDASFVDFLSDQVSACSISPRNSIQSGVEENASLRFSAKSEADLTKDMEKFSQFYEAFDKIFQ